MTVLLASIHLRGFASIGEAGVWAGVLALIGATTALCSVLWTLYAAAAVLAAPRRSLDELAMLDRADNSNFPNRRLEEPKSALVSYLVVERRMDLLGMSRDAIWELARDLAQALKATTLPQPPGAKIQIGTYTYNTDDDSDSAALVSLALDLETRAQRVVDAAASFETRCRFKRLRKGMKVACIPFVASVLLLLWLQTLPPVLMNVKKPIEVQVITPKVNSDPCSGRVLEGVAIGGTMDEPIVVIPSQGGCPPKKITDTDELIVVPVLK
ncbi:hypothetical protein [Nonomuraea aridisoli]|uniref:hypothetical protein n=1 Tax=Nonomuraea aridisoli TaxID=2070368 RepID=UPI0011B9447C|nr:hypothetical protein [Nonomuraea aridisoli]